MSDLRIQDIDLIVQIGLVLLLAYGYWQVKARRSIKIHASLFALATSINLATVIIIMLPLFLAEFDLIVELPLTFHSFFMWTHHLVSLLAIALSLLLLAKWRGNTRKSKACGGRKLMKITFFTWFASALLGIILYSIELTLG